MITALDGPNATYRCAPEALLEGDDYTPSHALKTPSWTGYPTFMEPGAGHIDRSHQRRHGNGKGKGKGKGRVEEGDGA